MRLQYRLEPDWPVQAWLAECYRDYVLVRHGGRVETRDDWFCEAVWDGPFERGDFDQTDIVAGSGGRLRGGRLTFVPAGATVDRLQSITLANDVGGRAGHTLLSNSLACLVAAAGARISPTYRFYKRDFQSVVRGLTKYKRILHTSAGPCRLWYFHNVEWDGQSLRQSDKPFPQRDFSSFERYHAFLDGTLAAVTENSRDRAREHAMGLIGTMSSGYDSTTVGAMARHHGLREIVTFDEARGGDPDSGVEAARFLGLRPLVVRREAWRQCGPFPEVAFLTADGYGEDRFFLGAEQHLRGKLMLTGFHGDKIWGKSPYSRDSLVPHPEIKRGDPSGLTMTEFRLSAGYINCPVPFWGARQIHEVVAISRDPSMRPWDVPGYYSRPICRRIVETAGVPREVFGIAKRAGSVTERVLTEASKRDYLAWCARHGIEGELFDRVIRRSMSQVPEAVRGKLFQMFYSWRVPSYRDYFFPWALERRAEAYRPTRPAYRPGHAFIGPAEGAGAASGRRAAVAV
jgi:hypothetical protein